VAFMSEPAAPQLRRRTGPARRLTRQQVVHVALEVMSNQGLDAVSFRTIALRLGVDPKALYTYVDGKDDLLAAMFDETLADLDLPEVDDPRPASEQIIDLLVSLRRALINNPDLLRMVRPASIPGWNTGPWERMVRTLYELNLEAEVAQRVYGRLVRYTLGSAMYARRTPGLEPSFVALTTSALEEELRPFALELLERGPLLEDEASFTATIRNMLERRIGED
jgi:TetR/AcrR family tetracycline transcriptional repressor